MFIDLILTVGHKTHNIRIWVLGLDIFRLFIYYDIWIHIDFQFSGDPIVSFFIFLAEILFGFLLSYVMLLKEVIYY